MKRRRYIAIVYISDIVGMRAQVFTAKLLCIMNMGLFGAMVAFLQFFVEGRRRVSIAGGVGAAFALAVFVAPLAIIVSYLVSYQH